MAHLQKKPIREQFKGLIQFTRWRVYVPFVVPLTILGALLAARPHGILLDWRIVVVTAANILAVAYAYMINDIEDAPEAALVPERARRNLITLGMVNIRTGYTVCRVVAAATLILYAFGGLRVFIVGLMILLLSHMYSWRPVRLKAYPVTDIVTHSLMLSGLLLLAGYFIYHHDPGVVWFVAVGATLFSVYGQLYSQLQNFDDNRRAGLQNTAIYLGEVATRRIMHLSAIVSLLCLLVAIVRDVFPVAFLGSFLVAFVVASLMQGQAVFDENATPLEIAEAQAARRIRGLLVVNMIIVAWLIYSVGDQANILKEFGFGF